MHKKRFYLPMNLQHFSEEPADPSNPTEPTEPTADEPEDETPTEPTEPEEKKFTQSEINKAIHDRLARERKKQEEKQQAERDEAERKRLEDEKQYKELAETLQKQLDNEKADALTAKKQAVISGAGYSKEQAEFISKLVEGKTDEEIKTSLEAIKSAIPPKKPYADPGEGNGRKYSPSSKDAKDSGSNAWDRIKDRVGIK